jgi:hypothetical protein
MANIDPAAALFDANTTFGAFNIGFELSLVLLGILTLQSYNYFTRFPKDPLWIKAIVRSNCTIQKIDQLKIRHLGHIHLVGL